MKGKAGVPGIVMIIALMLGFILYKNIDVRKEPANIQLVEVGRHPMDGAEISAFDPVTARLFVTGAGTRVEVFDLSDPARPTAGKSLPLKATSVAVRNGIVAIAVPNPEDRTQPGHVYLFDSASSLDQPLLVEAGALPDMLTFTPDGERILVANEGEPGDSTDPEGSITVIDVSRGIESAQPNQVMFTKFNELRSDLVDKGVRIFPEAASVAQDLEPEYIAVSPDGETAWVTLQENNSLAVLHVTEAEILDIVPFGYKDHNQPGNGIDASDQDGKIQVANWPVLGMYMPDGIAAFEMRGNTYLITANEGDTRAGEAVRVQDLALDPAVFPAPASLQQASNLGRLAVTTVDRDADGDVDVLYSFGTRSFSIWSVDGTQVFDSGEQFEQLVSELVANQLNSEDGILSQLDSQSDNKGPEPEGVATGVVNGNTYAFIGLERADGVVVYDLSDPTRPSIVEFVRSKGDVSPEGLLFIPADASPNGIPLLVVTNETSSTVTIYQIEEKVE